MDRKIKIVFVLLICVTVVFAALEYQQNQPVKLQGVQVNDYQGKKLTPINSMPENIH